MHISTKDMNDTVLNLLCNADQVHVLSAARRTLHYHLVAVILMEALQAFD